MDGDNVRHRDGIFEMEEANPCRVRGSRCMYVLSECRTCEGEQS